MDPVQKFLYKLFCINFCGSSCTRRWMLLLHLTVTTATILFVLCNQDITFTVPLSTNDSGTSSVAVRVWFSCYIFVYMAIYLEGFVKDSVFNRTFNSVIRIVCQKHRDKGTDYYALVIYGLLFLDMLYLVLSYCSNSYYQYLHNSCLLPKLTIRLRLWSYLHLCRSVLLEFEDIIQKVERIPSNATEEELLKVQQEYSDLWMISQLIGDYYVFSLCCIIFYVFFDMIVYFFWFFTIDFADDRYFFCEETNQIQLTKIYDLINLIRRLRNSSRAESHLWYNLGSSCDKSP